MNERRSCELAVIDEILTKTIMKINPSRTTRDIEDILHLSHMNVGTGLKTRGIFGRIMN